MIGGLDHLNCHDGLEPTWDHSRATGGKRHDELYAYFRRLRSELESEKVYREGLGTHKVSALTELK